MESDEEEWADIGGYWVNGLSLELVREWDFDLK
jgi:hypothetical protein